jgi:hypothetical protein
MVITEIGGYFNCRFVSLKKAFANINLCKGVRPSQGS